MSLQAQNKKLIERFANEFVNHGALAAYQAIVSPDYRDHTKPQGGYQSMLNDFNAMRAGMATGGSLG